MTMHRMLFPTLMIALALFTVACGSETTSIDTAEESESVEDESSAESDAVAEPEPEDASGGEPMLEDDGSVITRGFPSIEGTWTLVRFNETAVDVAVNTANIPELEFSNGTVLGNFGCNDGGGNYEQVEDSVRFSEIAATEEGCPRPDGGDGLVPTETLLLEVFNSGELVAVEIDGSFMSWSQGEILLAFERAS